MAFSDSFFAAKFGITQHDLEGYLSEALSRGGDYADLYFEYLATSSISIDESIVKSATQGVSLGLGVRVISGERTGYAYSDDLSPEKIRHAAQVAAMIASAPSKVEKTPLEEGPRRNLYPVFTAPSETAFKERVALAQRADIAARAYDPRIFQVQVVYADNLRQVLVATSDGMLNYDRQPMTRMSVFVLARDKNGVPQQGHAGGGGRHELDWFTNVRTPEYFAQEAARQAIVQLGAVEAPAGEQIVVLGPGWPGVLLHEAIGHGLEGDFNRKGSSAFAGRMGERVAAKGVTVVDDGTLPNRRGSLNIDDEGNPTQCTTLIEDGILKGYIQDSLNARLMKMPVTGNARRESYAALPMPRMTNTYMLNGDKDPGEILASVKNGLYAVNFGGGQVDITNGKFVFSASEAYMIENGKITYPVKGATLIGSGPESLKYVTMIGNDMALDGGVGVCGKEGQSVPVGVGQPTLRIEKMTVGGTV